MFSLFITRVTSMFCLLVFIILQASVFIIPIQWATLVSVYLPILFRMGIALGILSIFFYDQFKRR